LVFFFFVTRFAALAGDFHFFAALAALFFAGLFAVFFADFLAVFCPPFLQSFAFSCAVLRRIAASRNRPLCWTQSLADIRGHAHEAASSWMATPRLRE
jgi:hypothetical protein